MGESSKERLVPARSGRRHGRLQRRRLLRIQKKHVSLERLIAIGPFSWALCVSPAHLIFFPWLMIFCNNKINNFKNNHRNLEFVLRYNISTGDNRFKSIELSII